MNIDESLWHKVQRLRAELKVYFKQRDDVVDGALVALLCGCHVLLLGPPGTAKSLLVQSLCQLIDGAEYFYCCLNKFITWRDLACSGVQVHERAEPGVRVIDFRYSESSLLRALVVFLDEIYKMSGAGANSLLSFLNERTYSINAGEVKKAPVLSVFGASNEMPTQDEEHLQAFSDRFLLRYDVDYLTVSQENDTAFVDMLAGTDPRPGSRLTLAELEAARRQVEAVHEERSTHWLINAIRAALELQHGIQPSDRRYKDSLAAVRACAWLNGRTAVSVEDLVILEHILWTRRERKEQDAVRQVVRETVAAPSLSAATALMDEANRIHREALGLLDEAARTLAFDETRRQARERALREAAARERRLEEIVAALDAQVRGQAGDAAGATALRTIRNEVNVLRKALVHKRGIENPFLEVERWASGASA